MSIFSNTSFVSKPFTKITSAAPNLSGVPNWKQSRGTLPGMQPVVPPLGVTARLQSNGKAALNRFTNILQITS